MIDSCLARQNAVRSRSLAGTLADDAEAVAGTAAAARAGLAQAG